MKIAVCSLYIGEDYKNALKLCNDSLIKYCNKHQYTLITDESVITSEREPMWYKVPLIRKYLGDYDYVVWIDADIMIMNHDIKLEEIIFDYMPLKDTMMALDSGLKINTGVWFLKNSEYNHNLLDMIYNLPELAGEYHEQGVFGTLYNRNTLDLKDHTVVIPEHHHGIFNSSMYTYNYGYFLIHFLGIRENANYYLKMLSEKYYPFQLDDSEEDVQRLTDIKSKLNNRYTIPKPYTRICVAMFVHGDKYSEDVIHYSQKSLKDYCTKYGYDYALKRQPYTLVNSYFQEGDQIPLQWNKIFMMIELIESKRYDYIVWMDADTMICNHDISLRDLMIKHMDNKCFMLSRDISEHINTGVMFVKSCDYSLNVLKLILSTPELRYRNCEDQDVFNRIYERNLLKLKDNSVIFGQDQQQLFNACVGYYFYGVFLVHFFSMSKDLLKIAFRDFYPLLRENENLETYMSRINWLKERKFLP